MKLGSGDVKRLWLPVAACFALIAASAACTFFSDDYLAQSRKLGAAAAAQRAQVRSKLSRANEEKSEIEASLQQYQALAARGVIGEENRLDWVDTVTTVRNELRMFDITYSIEPQKPLEYPGFSPGGDITFMASRVKMSMQLLHEGDLLNFIDALERRSKSYLSVRSCDVRRESRGRGTALAPRLQADCVFDLITIRVGKPA